MSEDAFKYPSREQRSFASLVGLSARGLVIEMVKKDAAAAFAPDDDVEEPSAHAARNYRVLTPEEEAAEEARIDARRTPEDREYVRAFNVWHAARAQLMRAKESDNYLEIQAADDAERATRKQMNAASEAQQASFARQRVGIVAEQSGAGTPTSQPPRTLAAAARRENGIHKTNEKRPAPQDDALGGEENKEENPCHKDGDTQNDGERGVKILVHDASQ